MNRVREALVTSVACVPPSGTAGQVPEHPAVRGAEQQLARLGPFAGAVDVAQDPGQLGAGEVGRERQAGLLAEAVGPAVGRQFIADLLRPHVLPDNRVVHRLARALLPHHRGFALVGDADGGDVVPGQAGPGERRAHYFAGVVPDLQRVVFHPARLRENLPVLPLAGGDRRTAVVENDRARGGGALVDRQHELGHVSPSTVCPGNCARLLLNLTGGTRQRQLRMAVPVRIAAPAGRPHAPQGRAAHGRAVVSVKSKAWNLQEAGRDHRWLDAHSGARYCSTAPACVIGSIPGTTTARPPC